MIAHPAFRELSRALVGMTVLCMFCQAYFSLQFAPGAFILHLPMTPTVLLAAVLIAVLAVAIYTVRRLSRDSQHDASVYLGVVSTRWISELRRDDPWTRS